MSEGLIDEQGRVDEQRHASAVTSDPVGFALAIDALPVAIIVFRGAEHVIVGANRMARSVLGDRLVGHPAGEVFGEVAGRKLADIREQVFRTGRRFSATECRVVLGGEVNADERIVNIDLVPLRDPNGQISGVAAQIVDVTEVVLRRRAVEADATELRERYAGAQDAILTFQRSLLPRRLPVLPGFHVAARYLVTGTEYGAGGDWFDAVPLDGRLTAVVGDVVGYGPDGVAAMGQLRAVLKDMLLDGEDLATVLARLDRFARKADQARGATVCLVMIDQASGAARYACAGHPPPLVVSANGTSRFLPTPGGGPLGTAAPTPAVGHATLLPGDLLLCYSDGLVDRPGEDLVSRLAELASVATAAVLAAQPSLTCTDGVDRLTEVILERMSGPGYHDDVTLLAVFVTGRDADDFLADLPAEPGQLPVLRDRLRRWLSGLGARESDVAAIENAVLEAVANAIEHAYSGPGGRVQVEGVIDGGGRACMTVIDRGKWRPADAEAGDRGRGLGMMRDWMDSVEIERSAGGTTLLLDRWLRREPVLSAAGHVRRPAHPAALTITVDASTHPRIVLDGPIDMSTVAELRRRLWSANRGGALPLTVDMRQVTHLASAGIQMLFEFVEEMTADDRRLDFVAPPGSPARHALTLSALDRIVTCTDA